MNQMTIPATLNGIRTASRLLHQDNRPVEQMTHDIEHILTTQIQGQPRSRQRRIGPSEIGNPCQHCLAARLAGWQKTENGLPWPTTVGTAIHEAFEAFFTRDMLTKADQNAEDTHRFWTEEKIMVGTIGGQQIWGSTDLLDVATGATIDWKCVSKTSLDHYRRRGPSDTYRIQAHLYAKGWNDAGIPVRHVAICFLPRTTSNFYSRYWWHEEYQPQIAADALERANRLHNNLQALEAVSVQTRDTWISSLPRAESCWDCSRYQQDYTPTPPTTGGVLLDLPTSGKQQNNPK